MKKAVVYVRRGKKSKLTNDDPQFKAQLRLIGAYLHSYNLHGVKLFVEKYDESGSQDFTEWNNLKQFLTETKIKTLLITKWSIHSDKYRETLREASLLYNKKGVNVICIEQPLDFTKQYSELLEQMHRYTLEDKECEMFELREKALLMLKEKYSNDY